MYEAVEGTTEESYRKDVIGRRYRNSEVVTNGLKCEEFVADDKLVVPRYLISVKDKMRFEINLRLEFKSFFTSSFFTQ